MLARRASHHPEIGNNLVPYNVVGHRQLRNEARIVFINTDNRFGAIYTGLCNYSSQHSCDMPCMWEMLFELHHAFYQDSPFVKV